jgi:hypothetical protein
MQYMIEVPEQFKDYAKVQYESNRRFAEKDEPRKTLDWMIKTVLGSDAIGYADIFPYASRQINPFTFFYGNAESSTTPATAGLLADLDELRPVSTVTDDQWVEFTERVAEFIVNLDDDNREDRWAELDVEDNSWSDPESDPYMESQFARDIETTLVPSYDNTLPIGEFHLNDKGERVYGPDDEWEFAYYPDGSFDFPKYTVGARNWGFYNEAATEGYALSLMRVRWFANMLLIGGVKVKSSGLAECGVSGCRWSHQLTANSVEGSTVFDRRYAEYQVLLILAHLGEHSRTNPLNYWQPIDSVKRGRDTATMKLDSASESQSGLHSPVRVKLLEMLVD